MPTYTYRCPACGDHDARFPLAEVPARTPCDCGAEAVRRFTAPHLGAGRSAEMRLLEATAATAERPAVVAAPQGTRRARPQPRTTNPLHQRLPRP